MTVSDQVNTTTEEIKILFHELLVEHSKLYCSNPPNSGILNLSGNHSWHDLGKDGKQIQSKLKDKYTIYYEILKTLIKNQPQTAIKDLEKANKTMVEAIEQNGVTWKKNTNEVLENINVALLTLSNLIEDLYSHNNKYLLVPDTNAFLSNPNFEKWVFEEFNTFSIILTPTILSELDYHKINHRNEDVRKKSKTIINKIKEYRRRGKLSDGVPIIKDKIFLQTIAIEPNMKDTLPWLEENNNDDKFITSILEVMRKNSKSIVYLVTNDINLQNKAEYSMIPFIESPEII